MTDRTDEKINELAIAMGQMKVEIADVKILQTQMVELLRKQDRIGHEQQRMEAQLDRHETQIQTLNEERIRASERKATFKWWIENWQKVLWIFAAAAVLSVLAFPQLLSMVT